MVPSCTRRQKGTGPVALLEYRICKVCMKPSSNDLIDHKENGYHRERIFPGDGAFVDFGTAMCSRNWLSGFAR